jgi:hypothetical protein
MARSFEAARARKVRRAPLCVGVAFFFALKRSKKAKAKEWLIDRRAKKSSTQSRHSKKVEGQAFSSHLFLFFSPLSVSPPRLPSLLLSLFSLRPG